MMSGLGVVAEVLLVIVTIVGLLGSWQWALSERARVARERLDLKIDDLEACMHRLHAENVAKIVRLAQDVAVLKDRSFQRRHTDYESK